MEYLLIALLVVGVGVAKLILDNIGTIFWVTVIGFIILWIVGRDW